MQSVVICFSNAILIVFDFLDSFSESLKLLQNFIIIKIVEITLRIEIVVVFIKGWAVFASGLVI